jgi:hypothetical protein
LFKADKKEIISYPTQTLVQLKRKIICSDCISSCWVVMVRVFFCRRMDQIALLGKRVNFDDSKAISPETQHLKTRQKLNSEVYFRARRIWSW